MKARQGWKKVTYKVLTGWSWCWLLSLFLSGRDVCLPAVWLLLCQWHYSAVAGLLGVCCDCMGLWWDNTAQWQDIDRVIKSIITTSSCLFCQAQTVSWTMWPVWSAISPFPTWSGAGPTSHLLSVWLVLLRMFFCKFYLPVANSWHLLCI